MVVLTIYIKPSVTALGPPRQIRKIHRYHAVVGANGTTMVMIFVGGSCVRVMVISELFLPLKTYGAGVSRSLPNPNSGKAVKLLCPLEVYIKFL